MSLTCNCSHCRIIHCGSNRQKIQTVLRADNTLKKYYIKYIQNCMLTIIDAIEVLNPIGSLKIYENACIFIYFSERITTKWFDKIHGYKNGQL